MRYLLLIFMLCPTAFVQAQTATADTVIYSDFTRLSPRDYINLRLPPLHVLMENAQHSPQVSMYQSSQEVEEREMKTIRRSWLKHIKLNANYSYGSTDINSQSYNNNSSSSYPIIQNISGSEQSWWSVGGGLSLPLDEIFNRRNRLKQQKKRIESINFEVERYHDEVCLLIIDAYTTAIEQLSILENTVQTMIAAQAQYTVAEVDFINNKIDALGLSKQKSISNSALREYEKERAVLNKALLSLEVLSKTKIITQ